MKELEREQTGGAHGVKRSVAKSGCGGGDGARQQGWGSRVHGGKRKLPIRGKHPRSTAPLRPRIREEPQAVGADLDVLMERARMMSLGGGRVSNGTADQMLRRI